jgi:diaminohydroxyphosphoribosylaminopyrimidine deaminase / 5-amino-6-(5-phosphoribosylamino)uracil reductase
MSEGSLSVFEHEFWMRRCLALAERGWGKVSPNPMVGAVLVRDGVVLAEGWHDVFGGAHAERMLFEGLALGGGLELGGQNEDFSDCILYVSLEPCAHFGKTPPCANLILEKGVGAVVVGVLDPNPKVSGRGVEILRTAGVDVLVGVLENECRGLNRAFWVNQRLGRAAVVAKWAETGDGFMGSGTSDRVKISGAVAGDWVMELRRGMDAILVGVDTWDLDNPKLNVRGYEDVNQPVRIVLDRTGRGEYTVEGLGRSEGELWVIGGELNLLELLKWLYEAHGLGVILVEGGARVLESFFETDCVDEVHVLRNAAMVLGDGVKSPRIGNLEMRREDDLGLDEHWVWERDLG